MGKCFGVHIFGHSLNQQIFPEQGILSKNLIVYQMGRLCGGAHEISGIKAPIFLRGWVGGGWWDQLWWVGVGL